MAAALISLAVMAALGLGVRIYMGRDAEDRLAPGEGTRPAAVTGPLPANAYLACPPAHCGAVGAAASPVFEMPWERLREYWLEMIAAQSRVVRVDDEADRKFFAYVQHSAAFRFPDVVTAELVPLGPNRSSVAIFSRARYGELDFGVNRSRVETWLALLGRLASPGTPTR